MSQSLTLYDLSRELVELMDRYDALDSSMPVEEFEREEKQLRADLQAYAQAHVRKVDDIRSYRYEDLNIFIDEFSPAPDPKEGVY